MRFLPTVLISSALALKAYAQGATINTIVTLDYGSFTGLATDDIISFKGIRYAQSPVGPLRWRAPVVPPTTPLGNVNATQFGQRCIATTQQTVGSGTSEDCLFGNVYVPTGTTTESSLPVLVYFHGGGFQGGNPQGAIPDKLFQASTDPFIFVTFQYRLGQFGFLGGFRVKKDGILNAGLLDQRGALQWVQRYIGQFGGDKTRVTIWGQSAGAGATMYHLLGNGGNTEGLFRAAMGDSPSLNFAPIWSDAYVEAIFDDFSSFAGCGDLEDDEVMACLRNADSTTLARAGSQTISRRPSTLYVFAPIFDEAFLLDRAVEGFQTGRVARVPILFGSNTDEGAGWSNSLSDPAANTSMPNSTQQTVYNFLRGQYGSFTQDSFAEAVSLYPLENFDNSLSLQGQQMYGEARYVCTAALITSGVAALGLPSYQYHYNNPITGSGHSAEIAAMFSLNTPSNPDVQSLFDSMRQYWTSFVTSGAPVAQNGTLWMTASGIVDGSPRILLHPGDVRMEDIDDSLASRCAFWHSISEEINT